MIAKILTAEETALYESTNHAGLEFRQHVRDDLSSGADEMDEDCVHAEVYAADGRFLKAYDFDKIQEALEAAADNYDDSYIENKWLAEREMEELKG